MRGNEGGKVGWSDRSRQSVDSLQCRPKGFRLDPLGYKLLSGSFAKGRPREFHALDLANSRGHPGS